jgi:hypothetical protein
MAFTIESTYDGRGLIAEDMIVGAATLVAGSVVALTKGAGKPTATIVTTAVPDAVVIQGGVTGAIGKMIRIFRGDVLLADVTAADGTTAMSSGETTSHIALVGSQAQRVSATGLTLNGVTEAGGKMELLSYDSTKQKARVTIKA